MSKYRNYLFSFFLGGGGGGAVYCRTKFRNTHWSDDKSLTIAEDKSWK